MSIEKLNKMFYEKRALEKSLQALVEKLEIEVRREMLRITRTLAEDIEHTSFFVSIYTYYDEPRAAVLKNYGKEDEVRINIRECKIFEIIGDEDEETKRVIKIIEKWSDGLLK